MKQLLFLVFTSFVNVLYAQNSAEIFALDVTINGLVKTFEQGPCGFSLPSQVGITPTEDICLEAVWGYDMNQDSIICDSVPNNYEGKLAMARRSNCADLYYPFFALGAANAGAVAIANGNLPLHSDDCHVFFGQGMGDFQSTVPYFYFSRVMTDHIDEGLKAGYKVEICVRHLYLHQSNISYSYAMPAQQGVVMDRIAVDCVNRLSTTTDYTAQATITDPLGGQTVLTSATVSIPAGQNKTITFPSFTPDPDITGTYKIQYTTNQSPDTLVRSFAMTNNVWATDDLNVNQATTFPSSVQFWPASFVKTGKGGPIGSVQFGIANADKAAGVVAANNYVDVLLLDADTNLDGYNDWNYMLAEMNLIAYAEYSFTASTPAELVTVPLTTISPNDSLKPNHAYYVVLRYTKPWDALEPIQYLASKKVTYEEHPMSTDFITPIAGDNYSLDSGWPTCTPVIRFSTEQQLSGTDTPILSPAQYRISPNPASTFCQIDLNLRGKNDFVTIEIMDMLGRRLHAETHHEVQKGTFSLNIEHIPVGTNIVCIRTAQEGVVMHKMVKR